MTSVYPAMAPSTANVPKRFAKIASTAVGGHGGWVGDALPDRITLRTTFRDTRNSRQIALIGFFCAKCARRIFAIVSTITIPEPAPMSPMEATVDPPSPGSRLDADHPENGVLIPCLFTF